MKRRVMIRGCARLQSSGHRLLKSFPTGPGFDSGGVSSIGPYIWYLV